MIPFDIAQLPLPAVGAIFAAAAALIWMAGTRLSGYAEAISERTGIGTAFVGALLLGGITSLPELATTVSASVAGDPKMAVNNIFGGVAMQVAVLAVADMALRRRPLASLAQKPVILLQGVFLILVLVIAAAGIVIGEPEGLPVGPWSMAVLGFTLVAFYEVRRTEGHGAWRPVTEEGRVEEVGGPPPADDEDDDEDDGEDRPPRSLRRLIVLSAVAGLAILVAGVAITRAGEALATRTGLGSSFVGAVLVAASTSLPEVSTTVAAARLGRYDMAFSNVLGANLLDMALISVTDLTYSGPPVLNELGTFAVFGALLATAVTAVVLAGMIRRRVKTVRSVGVDSLTVAALYLGGLIILYTLR